MKKNNELGNLLIELAKRDPEAVKDCMTAIGFAKDNPEKFSRIMNSVRLISDNKQTNM